MLCCRSRKKYLYLHKERVGVGCSESIGKTKPEMNALGFIRVASCVPEVRPADVAFNISSIKELATQASIQGAEIVLFPELSVTAYTCADLFYQTALLDAAEKALENLAGFSRNLTATLVVGAPLRAEGKLYNCAVVIAGGHIIGVVPKTHLPNYNEFYEKRWFSEGSDIPAFKKIGEDQVEISTHLIFKIAGANVGIEICEDLWVPVPPSCGLAMAGADVILNLSATDEQAGKHGYLLDLIRQQSARCRCAYVYSSAGVGESSTDLIFSGNSIIAENGQILAESDRFSMHPLIEVRDIDIQLLRSDRQKFSTFFDSRSDAGIYQTIDVPCDEKAAAHNSDVTKDIRRHISAHPFTDGNPAQFRYRCDEISSMQAWGLAARLKAIGCRKAVIGISGGLDSTLALLVAAKAFDMLGLPKTGIIAITMPGFGTTGRTHSNALRLMELLGVTILEIPIGDAVNLHFRDIGQDPGKHDATYENSQARERTQILMDMANKEGGIVVGTGDLSELALGWCTYNGDQISMYGVNAGVPKTLVRYLVEGYILSSDSEDFRKVLTDICETPISPELLPAAADDSIRQRTEDLVGPYELHDFFIYSMLRNQFAPTKIFRLACAAFEGKFEPAVIKKWLVTFYRRFFSQQFKRSCMPDGMKVGSVCLSPRGDWRMPSDASANLWIKEAEQIEI